jgi:hypothetical protein
VPYCGRARDIERPETGALPQREAATAKRFHGPL